MESEPAQPPGRSGRASLLALLGAAAVLLVACGGSSFSYVGDSSTRTAFRVPTEWHRFNKKQMLVATGLEDSPESNRAFRFLVGFDASPDPAVKNVLTAGSDHPVLFSWVRELDEQDRDSFSMQNIRNAVYPVDQLVQNHQAEIVSVEEVVLDGGIRGAKLVYNLSGRGNLNLIVGNEVATVHQIGLVDPATRLFYLLLIQCRVDCYQDHQRTIDLIADSYRVRPE